MTAVPKINFFTSFEDDLTAFPVPAIREWADDIFMALSSHNSVKNSVFQNPTLPKVFLEDILVGPDVTHDERGRLMLFSNPQLSPDFITETYWKYDTTRKNSRSNSPGPVLNRLIDRFVENSSTPPELLEMFYKIVYLENISGDFFANPNCPEHLFVSALKGEQEIVANAQLFAFSNPNLNEQYLRLLSKEEFETMLLVSRVLPERVMIAALDAAEEGELPFLKLAKAPSMPDELLRSFIFINKRLMHNAAAAFNASAQTLTEIHERTVHAFKSSSESPKDLMSLLNFYLNLTENHNTSSSTLSQVLDHMTTLDVRWVDSTVTAIYSNISVHHNTSQDTLEKLIQSLSNLPGVDYFRTRITIQSARMLKIFHPEYQDVPWEWLEQSFNH